MNDTLKKMKQAEVHPGPLPLSGAWFSFNKPHLSGRLGGSAVERLPLAQVVILGSWDRVPHQAPCMESLLLPLPVSLMNK